MAHVGNPDFLKLSAGFLLNRHCTYGENQLYNRVQLKLNPIFTGLTSVMET